MKAYTITDNYGEGLYFTSTTKLTSDGRKALTFSKKALAQEWIEARGLEADALISTLTLSKPRSRWSDHLVTNPS